MDRPGNKQPPVFPVEPGKIPEAELLHLSNNVPVYLIPSATDDIVRLEFIFSAGQVKEDLPLLASFTSMMLTEGSKNHTSEKLLSKIDYYGAFINLYADNDRAGLIVVTLNRHASKIIELVREILFGPVFPLKELNNLIQKRVQNYRISRERVQTLAMERFFESVFGSKHPYGRQIRETDFRKITPALLKDFHSKYYTPDNMSVIAAGRISRNLTSMLDHTFGNLPSHSIYIEEPVSLLRGKATRKILVPKPGAVQNSVRIGSPSINKRHPDYQGLKIVNTILGGYFGSRLMKNLREEKGFTYGIRSGVSSLDLTGFKVISAEVNRENTRNAIEEIYREIHILQNLPVEVKELNVIRNFMLGEMVRMFDGPFARAESFKALHLFGLDTGYYYRFAEKIKSINSDEIIELARTYYKTEDLYEIIAGMP